MRTRIRNVRAALYALAVTSALGYGGATAVAAPTPFRPCPLTAIGGCGTQARCEDLCARYGGNVSLARCENGCCFCPLPI